MYMYSLVVQVTSNNETQLAEVNQCRSELDGQLATKCSRLLHRSQLAATQLVIWLPPWFLI
jgi:hypothetical protein